MSKVNNFTVLEEKINSDIEFCENGVKVIYKSDKKLNEEIDSIKEKVKCKYGKAEISNNNITIKSKDEKIQIDLYEKSNCTSVEMVIINNKKEKNMEDLMKELTELEGNKAKDVQYFSYLKGIINNKEDGLNLIKKTRELKEVNTLNVRNGYVGTAVLYNKERVNFAVSTYNTGTYLIIGTPIIFTTY